MRMGEGDSSRVWFRNVYADASWNVVEKEDGTFEVEDDTLESLVAADPGKPDRKRELTDLAFRGAYEAWAVAREDAHQEWLRSTDPNEMAGAVPRAFRDATGVVLQHGQYLGGPKQGEILRRLKSVPTTKAKNRMRGALQAGGTSAEQIERIIAVLDEFGIQPAAKIEPLPVIDVEDVRLIAWMAVVGTGAQS